MGSLSIFGTGPIRAAMAAVTVALASCGGGGTGGSAAAGSGPAAGNTPGHSGTSTSSLPAEEPAGIYGARVEGFASPSMMYFALNDGRAIALLGDAGPTGFGLQSVMYVTLGSWAPTAEPGWTYNTFAYQAGPGFGDNVVGYRVQASHVPSRPSLSGTMTRSSGAWHFVGGPMAYSNYDFNATLSVSEVVGRWNLREVAGNDLVLDIDALGRLSGRFQGCSLSGTVAPASTRKGYLSLSLSLDTTCPSMPDGVPVPFEGFVAVYTLSSGLQQMVLHGAAYWGQMDAAGIMALGVR